MESGVGPRGEDWQERISDWSTGGEEDYHRNPGAKPKALACLFRLGVGGWSISPKGWRRGGWSYVLW